LSIKNTETFINFGATSDQEQSSAYHLNAGSSVEL